MMNELSQKSTAHGIAELTGESSSRKTPKVKNIGGREAIAYGSRMYMLDSFLGVLGFLVFLPSLVYRW